MINEKINEPNCYYLDNEQNCYYLDNVKIINNNNYLLLSSLSGIASFFIGNYLVKYLYNIRNNTSNTSNDDNDILMASVVNIHDNDINNNDTDNN